MNTDRICCSCAGRRQDWSRWLTQMGNTDKDKKAASMLDSLFAQPMEMDFEGNAHPTCVHELHQLVCGRLLEIDIVQHQRLDVAVLKAFDQADRENSPRCHVFCYPSLDRWDRWFGHFSGSQTPERCCEAREARCAYCFFGWSTLSLRVKHTDDRTARHTTSPRLVSTMEKYKKVACARA